MRVYKRSIISEIVEIKENYLADHGHYPNVLALNKKEYLELLSECRLGNWDAGENEDQFLGMKIVIED